MKVILSMLCLVALTVQVQAKNSNTHRPARTAISDADDFNPFDPNVEQKLQQMDQQYVNDTGLSPVLTSSPDEYHSGGDVSRTMRIVEYPRIIPEGSLEPCRREQCPVYIHVSRSRQRLTIYVNGVQQNEFPTSTGRAGFGTPNFDTHPNGRIYTVYSSKKYAGYNNMPFAVFINGGFAIHGAPGSEERELGHPASHGCVRVKTSNASIVNDLVYQSIRESGGSPQNVWITVEN